MPPKFYKIATVILFILLTLSITWYLIFKLYERTPVAPVAVGDISTSTNQSISSLLGGPLVIHPYLGFVYGREAQADINKFGFPGPEAISKKAPDKVLVGIFGASVAGNYYYSQQLELAKKLQSLPQFKNKKFEVFLVGLGGYRQPQQLMALNYFLALGGQFDIIINIDGFNEVALPYVENVPHHVTTYFPRSWYFLSQQSLDLESTFLTAEIQQHKENISRLENFFASPLLAILNPLRNQLISWEMTQISGIQAELSTRPGLYATDYKQTGPEGDVTDQKAIEESMVNMWAESSIQMSKLARANGALYLHLLQPNQYVPNSKPFTDSERKIAYNENQPYKKAVELFYPALIKKGEDIKSAGVMYADLTMLFKNVHDALYVDDCCHFNSEGSALITDVIVKMISESYQGK